MQRRQEGCDVSLLVVEARVEARGEEQTESYQGRNEVRPDIDRLVVPVEQTSEQHRQRVIHSIASPYVLVECHEGRNSHAVLFRFIAPHRYKFTPTIIKPYR